jgi:hypothetical protein
VRRFESCQGYWEGFRLTVTSCRSGGVLSTDNCKVKSRARPQCLLPDDARDCAADAAALMLYHSSPSAAGPAAVGRGGASCCFWAGQSRWTGFAFG